MMSGQMGETNTDAVYDIVRVRFQRMNVTSLYLKDKLIKAFYIHRCG